MSESGGVRGTSSWQNVALQQLDALYGFAMTLTSSKAESEDLVQETYMRAMQHYERLRPDTNMKAWMFTILRNVWLKKLRRGRSGPVFVSFDEDDVANQAIVHEDPQSVLFRIWERDEVRSSGVTGFDKEIGVCLRVARVNDSLETVQTLQVRTK